MLLAVGLLGLGSGALGAVPASAADAAPVARRSLPADLEPSLGDATRIRPPAYSDGCHARPGDVKAHACAYGVDGATRTVLLFGDSHALQWLPALQAIAAREGLARVLPDQIRVPGAAGAGQRPRSAVTRLHALAARRARRDRRPPPRPGRRCLARPHLPHRGCHEAPTERAPVDDGWVRPCARCVPDPGAWSCWATPHVARGCRRLPAPAPARHRTL